MYESPQSFASKAAIIEVLKRSLGEPLTRGELVDAVSRELALAPPEPDEVVRAIDEMRLESQLRSELVDGVEKFRFDESA
ncbi:MAG: hypothetical protein K0R38_4306 [Polyangiaceae bacterium]|jgi:hypothetical protein|nr:hypothetical protein [Polyangiaceae bacterium]